MNRLVLIDGNAILHRAYHALPRFTNKKGEPTGAAYGFVSMLLNVIKHLEPSHLAVAFDLPGPTFRNELDPKYQENRPEMDDEMKPQTTTAHRVVEAMNIPIYEKDGFEADDVIASLAVQASKIPITKFQIPNGSTPLTIPSLSRDKSQISKSKFKTAGVDEVVIVTGDRDLLQLVDDRVKLYMPVKGLSEAKLFGEKETEERMGVKPNQIPDLKALAGDPSDNYPGVAGIGPKTAVELIKQFDSIDRLYQNLHQVKKDTVRQKLTKDKDNAMLSYKLAQVVSDAPVTFDLQQAAMHDFLTKETIEVFGNLGFKSLLQRLTKMSQTPTDTNRFAPSKKQEKNNSGQMGLF